MRGDDDSTYARLANALARHGVGGTATRALSRLAPHPTAGATYALLGLDVLALRAAPEPVLADHVAPDIALRRGGVADVEHLEALAHGNIATMTERVVEERLAAGHELWLVERPDGAVVSACWLLHRRLPIAGRRSLRLPDGVGALEDVVTAEAFRGRGIGPSAWHRLARRCVRDGHALVAKVDVTNHASLRAFEKAGFAERARIDVVRHRWHTRVALVQSPSEPAYSWIASSLRGRARPS